MKKSWLNASILVVLVGCATSEKIPAEQLERSESSIRAADEVGAQDIPAAKLHVKLARDQTEEAKKMAAKGDSRAQLMLARAQADADLALVLARESAVHDEALQAAEDLKAVKARTTP